jgi:CHASE2 domain-containing sensor protein
MTWPRQLRLGRKLAVLVTAIPIFAGLEAIEALQKVEPRVAPLIAALRSADRDEDVRLVMIGDDDSATWFNGARKVSPADLGRLIRAIAGYQPRVLGVDFDTSAPEFKVLANEDFKIPIIWARSGTQSMINQKLYASPVLGGMENVRSAVVELLNDNGGNQFRVYQQWYVTDREPICFLPAALMGVGCPPPTKDMTDPPRRYLIQYHQRTTPIVQLEDIMHGRYPDLLKNKAVLLGCAYGGLDEWKTPLGWQHGVELLAQISETIRRAKPEPDRLTLALVAYACAVLVALPFFTSLGEYSALGVGILASTILATIIQLRFGSSEHSLCLLVTMLLVVAVKAYKRHREREERRKEARRTEEIKAMVEEEIGRQSANAESGTYGS